MGGELNKVKILSPDEVLKKSQLEDNLCIIVTPIPKSQVKNQLLLKGIKENQIDVEGIHIADSYYDYLNGLNEIIKEHIEDYEKVYFMLEDTFSKKVYLAKLNAKLSGDGKYLVNLSDDSKQYFDKELIELRKDEVFVDCGTWYGDTLDVFIQLTNRKYKKYIAIEANSDNYQTLSKRIQEKNYLNVKTFNTACWNEKTILNFQAGSSDGHITNEGNLTVQADSLDHLLKDEEVTFIKMDIEGAEENALKGAKNIIRKYKPILAICIYHKIKDYYKLPLLIKELNKEYQLYIRHYGEIDLETVCYAIPKGRLI